MTKSFIQYLYGRASTTINSRMSDRTLSVVMADSDRRMDQAKLHKTFCSSLQNNYPCRGPTHGSPFISMTNHIARYCTTLYRKISQRY